MEAKDIARLNLTTKLLSNFIFATDSFGLLLSSGLVNAYLDDYGSRHRYIKCILFLFDTKHKYYPDIEKRISNFKAFHDWYDVDETYRMMVFKVGYHYVRDLKNFKINKFDDFSTAALSVLPIRSFNFELNYSQEIYRYELCDSLTTLKRN
jgi:hypothetical protein